MNALAKLQRIGSLAYRSFEILWFSSLARLPIRHGKPHNLPGEVIVSLTSHRLRFPTLHLSLRTLLNQSVKPDRIVLWIADGEFADLPASVAALPIEVRTCPDWRSYKKIIGALKAFPDAFIVTADDDLYYRRDWLKDLLEHPARERVISAHDVHRFRVDGSRVHEAGAADDEATLEPSTDLLLRTGAGALFPPGCFHPDVTRDDLFTRLAPHCDDTWLTWMAYRAGWKIAATGRKSRLHAWLGTGATSLYRENMHGRADQQIQAVMDYFGPP